jgi:formylmethanofuran dehydrogenase subunit E
MECKKCGIDLSDREYKNVAQWPFCLECFQAMMDRAEEKKEIAETPAREPARTPQRCLVCEKEIEQGAGREMLGLMFCLQCYENLVKKPAIPPRTEDEQKEAGMDRMAKPAVAQVRVDFHSQVKCYRCGRQVPAIGSKQFDGNPYCPDCYYALPEIKAQQPKHFPAAISEEAAVEKEHTASEEHETGLRCQACQRQVLPDNLRTIEGFEICVACLTTDQDTALDIARTRHRRTLEKIKKELDM